MVLKYTNQFEQRIYDTILKGRVFFKEFSPIDTFDYYKTILSLYKNDLDTLFLYKNVPKRYGHNTNTEMVLTGKGFNCRIDCKYQATKGNIQIDNILGEINQNIVLNKLFEKELIFIVGGDGIDWNRLNLIKNTAPKNVLIFNVDEFNFWFNNTKT
jgi:hypothetical protein